MNIAAVFDGHIAYAFAWTMIHSLWQCALVASLLAVSMRITRNHGASLRYLQGIVALTVCVIVSAVTFLRYYDDIAAAGRTVQALGAGAEVSYSGGLWEQLYLAVNNSLDYIILFWLLGFAVQLYRYTNDFVQASTLKNHGCQIVGGEWKARFDRLARRLELPREITFKNSARVTSTCLIGHFKPVILLPIGLLTSLSAEEVEALILHELAHVKRNDYLVNEVQCFVRLLYFFNPAVLWISSRIDVERENACDDIAVRHCGSPALYANSLANISELELKLTTVLAAKKNKYQMLPRIKRLFSGSSGTSKSLEKLVSAVCACFMIAAMNVSAEQYDFLKANRAPETARVASAPAPDAMAAASEPPAVSPEPEPEPAAPVVASPAKPAPAPEPPALPAPAPALKASPEVDYAAKLAAADLPKAPSPRRGTAGAMKLARDSGGGTSSGELEPMQTPDFDQFSVASGFKLPLTRKIYISEPDVDFAEIWLKRFRGQTSANYRDVIVQTYGRGLVSELEKSLAAAGWEVVDSPAADALRLSPRLMDLYIYAPESVGIKETIIAIAGQSGVELVFRTPDGRPFMKIVDYRNTRESAGSPFVANRATNFQYFRMLMSDWSGAAVKYLERIMNIVERQERV